MSKKESGFNTVVVLLIVVMVALIGFAGWYVWRSKNKSTSDDTSANNSSEKKPEEADLPTGFIAFSDKNLGVAFAYPESWGGAEIGPSPESEHLVIGSEYEIIFSQNENITAGVVSDDREHDPKGGHGGVVYAATYADLDFDQFTSYGTSVVDHKDSNGFIIGTALQSEACVGVGRIMVHDLEDSPKYQKIAFLYFDKKAESDDETICEKNQYKNYLLEEHLAELKKVYETIK